MKHTARKIAGFLVTAVLALSLAACGGSSGADSDDNRLRIAATGTDSLPFTAILQVGIDKGWFKEAGVDASMVSGGGGGNTLRVVSSGDADLAITGSSSVVLAARKPAANLSVIGSWFQVNDFHWITPDQGAELKDATLGFSSAGSATELLVKALQEAKPGDNIKAQAVGGTGDNWAAAKAGRITAGWAMHPLVTQYTEEEGAKTLVAARDILGDHPADLVAVNNDYANDHADELKAFFQAAEKSFAYVRENPDEAAKDLAPLLKMDADLIARAIKDTPDYQRAYSLTIDPKALKNLSDLMQAAGQIEEPIDWSKVLDQQYLPQSAQADLG
ncbi:ABC transporter substrate-binding protein [Saccharopolyspora shandongensis]|uniref:ABC transporter substrate-binding protein n=1 Tax=Saccharopolyspora shandongensis TaxID=418495 RepID=UPI0033C7C03B